MASGEKRETARGEGMTLEDVREQLGDRWDCRAITAGYVGVPTGSDGTPIPRYGRTPDELLENILHSEQSW